MLLSLYIYTEKAHKALRSSQLLQVMLQLYPCLDPTGLHSYKIAAAVTLHINRWSLHMYMPTSEPNTSTYTAQIQQQLLYMHTAYSTDTLSAGLGQGMSELQESTKHYQKHSDDMAQCVYSLLLETFIPYRVLSMICACPWGCCSSLVLPLPHGSS